MPRFRKKPVEIEARQFSGVHAIELADWCQGRVVSDLSIKIDTLEGTMIAGHGDWIIRGVQGEFYPCKPDIFEATYDPV